MLSRSADVDREPTLSSREGRGASCNEPTGTRCSWYKSGMRGDAPNDTDPRIEAVLLAGYRAMSVSQKLERVSALTQTVQELALLDIRRRHPGADRRELALRLASRWLDADLMKRAFGWDVDSAGF